MTDNVIPFTPPTQGHLPTLAVQIDTDGSVTSLINTSPIIGDDEAFETEITPVGDSRFFVVMKDGAKKMLWIVERFGIIRPCTPIEGMLWARTPPTMAPDPSPDELKSISQSLLVAAREGLSDPKVLVGLLGYASEMLERAAARASGQRLPIFTEKAAPEDAA